MKKLFKFSLLVLLAYLLQATVAHHIAIGGVAPNLAFALAAVVTVALGKKYTFCLSMAVGYLLEIMLPALDYINLIAYPVCAMIPAIFLADKSERALEERQALGKKTTQLEPHIRTLLCACISTLFFEVVNVFYTFLSGVSLNAAHFGRAIFDVVYTVAITFVLQYPLRRWLGVHRIPKAR